MSSGRRHFISSVLCGVVRPTSDVKIAAVAPLIVHLRLAMGWFNLFAFRSTLRSFFSILNWYQLVAVANDKVMPKALNGHRLLILRVII